MQAHTNQNDTFAYQQQSLMSNNTSLMQTNSNAKQHTNKQRIWPPMGFCGVPMVFTWMLQL